MLKRGEEDLAEVMDLSHKDMAVIAETSSNINLRHLKTIYP